MPTQAYFDQCPPFPSDIEVAKLQPISYSKLLDGDEIESKAMFQACRESGFFLLDFRHSPIGEDFLSKAASMFDLNSKIHTLEVDELMEYAYKPPHSLFG
jgi:hypothetical protein